MLSASLLCDWTVWRDFEEVLSTEFAEIFYVWIQHLLGQFVWKTKKVCRNCKFFWIWNYNSSWSSMMMFSISRTSLSFSAFNASSRVLICCNSCSRCFKRSSKYFYEQQQQQLSNRLFRLCSYSLLNFEFVFVQRNHFFVIWMKDFQYIDRRQRNTRFFILFISILFLKTFSSTEPDKINRSVFFLLSKGLLFGFICQIGC